MTSPGNPDFKTRDAASYDPVARRFEDFTARFTTPLAERLLDAAALAPGLHVLDVGTGTGIVSLSAARRVRPGGRVVGIDLSEGMLATARAKAEAQGVTEVELLKMDAERLELPDQAFDVVVSLYALFHFPNPGTALREMYRVLRPGGRLVLGVGSGPALLSGAGLKRAAQVVGERLRAATGRELTAPAFLDGLVSRHLPAAPHSAETHLAQRGHHRPHDVGQLVKEAGFQDLATFWEGREEVLATPEEFWDLQETYSSHSRKRLSETRPEKRESVRQEFLEESRRVQERGGRLVYRHAALYVSGRRP